MLPNPLLDELVLFLHYSLPEQSMAFPHRLLKQQSQQYLPKNYAVRCSFLKLIYSYYSPFSIYLYSRTVSSLPKVKNIMLRLGKLYSLLLKFKQTV